MKIKSPYQVLGVSNKATVHEIKTTYKKLALKYHPDRGGDIKKMQEITWARDLLLDEENLYFYNKFGVESKNHYRTIAQGILNEVTDNDDKYMILDPYDRILEYIDKCQDMEQPIKNYIRSINKDLDKLKLPLSPCFALNYYFGFP